MLWDRPKKNEIRERIFKHFPRSVSTFLDFPAATMLSVLEAKKQKVLAADTRCLFVEKNENDAETIEKTAKKLKVKCTVFGGELHNLTNLPFKINQQKLEAANFDTCSTPNPHILTWISREICQRDLWKENGVFSFTFQEVPRGSQPWYESYTRTIGKRMTFAESADGLIRCSLWQYNVELLWTESYHDTTEKSRLPTMVVSIYRNVKKASGKQADLGHKILYKTINNLR